MKQSSGQNQPCRRLGTLKRGWENPMRPYRTVIVIGLGASILMAAEPARDTPRTMTEISPAVISSRPATMRRVVVLPQPEGPSQFN